MGNIEEVAYKALCTAFSSKIQIMQLNGKASTRSKQIQWLMDAMKYKKQQATNLWVRRGMEGKVDYLHQPGSVVQCMGEGA